MERRRGLKEESEGGGGREGGIRGEGRGKRRGWIGRAEEGAIGSGRGVGWGGEGRDKALNIHRNLIKLRQIQWMSS